MVFQQHQVGAWHELGVTEWGLLVRDPRPQQGPSWRTPLLMDLETCRGVCTQSKARAGSGMAELSPATLDPRPVMAVPGCTTCARSLGRPPRKGQ